MKNDCHQVSNNSLKSAIVNFDEEKWAWKGGKVIKECFKDHTITVRGQLCVPSNWKLWETRGKQNTVKIPWSHCQIPHVFQKVI